jgi:hypothetical protein
MNGHPLILIDHRLVSSRRLHQNKTALAVPLYGSLDPQHVGEVFSWSTSMIKNQEVYVDTTKDWITDHQ